MLLLQVNYQYRQLFTNYDFYRCNLKGCERAFDNHQALSLHMAWHRKGGQRGGGAPKAFEPKVMLNRRVVEAVVVGNKHITRGGHALGHFTKFLCRTNLHICLF